jgi:hypothetical protein
VLLRSRGKALAEVQERLRRLKEELIRKEEGEQKQINKKKCVFIKSKTLFLYTAPSSCRESA